MKLSIIIPCYNEQDSIAELYERLVVESKKYDSEIIFVDDGSSDNTWQEISKIKGVRAYKLRKNFGKSYALDVALKKAKGEVIVTMDADLQDDPAEIPNLLAKIDEGFDMVVGWKKNRNDPKEKTLPSKIFNGVVRKTFNLKIHDFNCGLKAFKRKIFDSFELYGELHRYIPVLASSLGYKVTEIEVQHHARKHGVSKFGVERYIRGFLDLFTVLMITKYSSRPGHLFGGIGLTTGFLGFVILFYLSCVWMFTDQAIGDRPLLLLGIMLGILGVQFLCFGMLAELMIKRTPQENDVIIEEEL